MSPQSRALPLLGSIGLHILALGGYFILISYEPPIQLKPAKIQVSLTKLGKPRDEELLPRIDTSPPPPAAPILHTPKPKTPTHAISTQKSPPTPLEILRKRFGKASHQGQEHGSLLGSSLSKELADSYELQVSEILHNHYEIPRIITDQEAKKLKLLARLKINSQGKLIQFEIIQSSGNKLFDQAVVQGSQRIQSFGVPPLPLAKKYRTQGLVIQFCPLECL